VQYIETLKDMQKVLDYLFNDLSPLCSRLEILIITYIILELSKPKAKQNVFSCLSLEEDLGFSVSTQIKALEVARKYQILEVNSLPAKGRNIKLGKTIKDLLQK